MFKQVICTVLALAASYSGRSCALTADLSVELSNLTEFTYSGGTTEYLIVVRNHGPDDAPASRVLNFLPLVCIGLPVSCTTTGGAVCSSNGLLYIDEVLELPVASSVTYNAVCRVNVNGTGVMLNSTRVSPGAEVVDPNTDNNLAVNQEAVVGVWFDSFEQISPPPTVAGQ